ncbi:MAG TPA: OmpA family protein [Nitrospira sp.]|nr:OmpA family protein [Nitrospira sp.]
MVNPDVSSPRHASAAPQELALLDTEEEPSTTEGRDQYFTPGHYASPGGAQAGGGQTADSGCASYEPGEVHASKQEPGILSESVLSTGTDALVLADFGVGWRHVKSSTANHSLIRAWQRVLTDNPLATVEVTGFSDCVGSKTDNETLRLDRAKRVASLLGSNLRLSQLTVKAAPHGTFLTDNSSRSNRAMNRSVKVRIRYPSSQPQLGLLPDENLCGGRKCFSDEDIYPPEKAKGDTAASGLVSSPRGFKYSKDLKKGTMKWTLKIAVDQDKPGPAARIQIAFTPKPSYRSHTVTFLQTVVDTKADTRFAPPERTFVDIRPDVEEVEPFYGVDWNPATNTWQAESIKTPVPQGFKNQPSTNTDLSTYLFDEPWLMYAGQAKIFESVVVIPETGEVLGSLRWGVTKTQLLGGGLDDCTDLPSHGFDVAMQNYYSMPKGSDPQSPGRFDTIIDGYDFGVYELSEENKKKVDPIIDAFLKGSINSPTMRIAVSGFADAGEHDDPEFTSLMRALLVQRYMMSKGVPQDKFDVYSFGAAWARYLVSPGENRNRRVQIRTYYK